MLIDCTDFNHLELVRQRLADEGIEFPSSVDLVREIEVFNPRIFNYFSFHGKQVFISCRSVGRKRLYQLYCCNFNPRVFFGVEPISYNRHFQKYLCFELDSFEFIQAKFKSFCIGLLNG